MIHAHLAARAYNEAQRRTLKRRCPTCSLKQLTPEEKIYDAMRCGRVRKGHPAEGIEPRGDNASKS